MRLTAPEQTALSTKALAKAHDLGLTTFVKKDIDNFFKFRSQEQD